MDVSLTPELERLMREKAELGFCNSASEMIRKAAIGYRQLRSGNIVRTRSKQEFETLVRSER